MSAIQTLRDNNARLYDALKAAGPCVPIPYKGNTDDIDPKTELCMLEMYGIYLLKLIECINTVANPVPCCEAAGDAYCVAHEQCIGQAPDHGRIMAELVATLWPA